LPFDGLVMQYTNAFPEAKNSAMDNFNRLFQAGLKGDVCNVHF